MRVKDVLVDWPLYKWIAEEGETLEQPAGELKLLWFTTPDADGWFSVTAVDRQGREWSTFCRVQPLDIWRPLDGALASHLRSPLSVVGEAELER